MSYEQLLLDTLIKMSAELGILQSDIKHKHLSENEIVERITEIVENGQRPSNPKV